MSKTSMLLVSLLIHFIGFYILDRFSHNNPHMFLLIISLSS